MGDLIRIVRVTISQTASGLWTATSAQLPGMVMIHRDIKEIRADLPAAIKMIFKHREGVDFDIREIEPERGETKIVPDFGAIRKAA